MFRLRDFCLLGLKRPLLVSSGKVSSGVGAGLRVVRSSTISTPSTTRPGAGEAVPADVVLLGQILEIDLGVVAAGAGGAA